MVEDELQALRRNKTWKLVDRLPGKKIYSLKQKLLSVTTHET